MEKRFLVAGSIFGGSAVALGAFAAHGLKNILTVDNLRIFHTAVEYQFYHALALMITGVVSSKIRTTQIKWSGNFFITGILLFSGSLYCLSVFANLSFMGMITPIGGLCFLAGWLLLCLSSLSYKSS
ncbi:MAG: DUF423 domain-containing protein [Chitinophagales bacterium]|nr:DUF423 domain-containing protein [Chitinophagales bacterium]